MSTETERGGVLSHENKERLLEGKVCLITGGSRGIGRSVALEFARQGAKAVAINSRPQSKEQANKVVSELTTAGTDSLWIPGDVSNIQTGPDLIGQTVQEFGRLDVLVCNAGIRKDSLFVTMDPLDLHEVMSINFFGAFYASQAAVKQMIRQRPRGGSITFVSSVASEGSPGQANYAASKGALKSLAKTIDREYSARNIQATAVSLPLVDTDLTSDLSNEQRQSVFSMTDQTRALTPDEAAEIVVSAVASTLPIV